MLIVSAYLFFLLILFILPTNSIPNTPSTDLTTKLNNLISERSLKGLQIQVIKQGQQIFSLNSGIKNQLNQPIDSSTIFRIASLSKSFSSIAIMQLVQIKKISLNDSLTKVLGYQVVNPNYPNIPITVEMILSHQSSIAQTQTEYDQFLMDSYNAQDGYSVPDLKQILTKGGKYYNPKMFPTERKPGQYFHYSNLNFVIAGTIIQKISRVRFDQYQTQNILTYLSQGLTEIATYNVGKVKDPKNLGTLYIGNKGKWTPDCDNYANQTVIKERNLTGYVVGKNGAVFGPQGGLRASVKHLNNYMYLLNNKGLLKTGKRLLSEQSVQQLLRPRYQYHGSISGAKLDFHLYGLGLYTTSYLTTDTIIQHQVVRGHLGDAYGLISGYYFWKNYSFSYIVNGALYGYKYGTGTIYQYERLVIHKAVGDFVNAYQQLQNKKQNQRNLKTQ